MIWHLIDSRTVGGAERHIAMVVAALLARGIAAKAVLYQDYGSNPWVEQLQAEGIPVDVLPGSFGALLRKLQRESPAILHVHGYKAGIFGRAAATLCRIPVVTTFHTGARSAGRLGAYERLDEWMSIGQRVAVAAHVQKRLPYPSEVIGSFVRPSSAVPARTLPRHAGFVGRLSKEKRPDFFCELARLSPEDVQWHVYGDGPMYRELAAEYSGTVQFHGLVAQMAPAWRELGLLVMPSLFEGLPLAALEAMAAGIPVLASNVGGLPELVIDGKTGWLFESGDLRAARAAVEGWASLDEPQQATMRLACQDHVGRQFSEVSQIAKLLAVYQRAGLQTPTECRVTGLSSAR
jgi:glycosyltransferase involved in cell wall biosynthesis